MAKVTIRFNYFKMYLENGSEEPVFDPTDVFDYILTNKNKDYAEIVNANDYGEIDTNAFNYNERHQTYYFQIAKLRNENLPGKKRISSPREELPLEQNEYVSEFLTFIYDKMNGASIVQVNRSSLTIKELETYLTKTRRKVREYKQLAVDDYNVRCRIVPDPDKINEVRNADYIRKLTLKGSKVNLDALQDSNSLKRISDTIGLLGGVNFTLEISVERNAERNASLKKDKLLQIVDDIEDDEMKTKVSIKEDIDTTVEVVNLVEPRMTDIIKVEHDNSRNIGLEFLYNQFMENVYNSKRDKVTRLLDRGD